MHTKSIPETANSVFKSNFTYHLYYLWAIIYKSISIQLEHHIQLQVHLWNNVRHKFIQKFPDLSDILFFSWYRFFELLSNLMIERSSGFQGGSLKVSQHLSLLGVPRSSAIADMYFICHVTSQDQSIELSCKIMGRSSTRYATTLKSLMTIVNLIAKWKNASSKTWILQLLTTQKLSFELIE